MMSFRLVGLTIWLRLVEKRRLARIRDPQKARLRFEKLAARYFPCPKGVNLSSERFEGPEGPIAVEWTSAGRADRHAVVLYFHGGAYIMGSIATHRHIAARLAIYSGARVAMPEYRLAPENRWPCAVQDGLACYQALLNTGYEPERIAFAGDSAGGNLAFATFLAARDAGLPDPGCIATFSPWFDLTLTRKSLKRNARSESLLPASQAKRTRDFYISAEEAGGRTASPLFADIPAPPPVLIQASPSELLADDAAEMAEKLREAGGDVRLEWFARAPHAWHIFAGFLPEANRALARAGDFIAGKLGCGG